MSVLRADFRPSLEMAAVVSSEPGATRFRRQDSCATIDNFAANHTATTYGKRIGGVFEILSTLLQVTEAEVAVVWADPPY